MEQLLNIKWLSIKTVTRQINNGALPVKLKYWYISKYASKN